MKTSKHLNLRATRDCYHGFTLVELLAVMAIISLLVAMLLPTLREAQEQAKRSVCMSNEKQLGLAMAHYAGDFDDYHTYSYPPEANGIITRFGYVICGWWPPYPPSNHGLWVYSGSVRWVGIMSLPDLTAVAKNFLSSETTHSPLCNTWVRNEFMGK